MTTSEIKQSLEAFSDPQRAVNLSWFFKTGPGQYGEGDQFVGVTVPQIRKVAAAHRDAGLAEIQELLDSPIHEHRLCALIMLVYKFGKSTEVDKHNIYKLYLQNIHKHRINNWDLVDVTCRDIVGAYLWDKPRDVLFEMAKSDNLWERRVSIISTFYFISHGDPSTSLALAEQLLHDKHDLMHKAVGWTLRELGKRVDRQLLLDFLDQHAKEMPRTMLRYSIEHLSPETRKHYMAK